MKKLIIFLLLLPALAWGGDIEIARMNPYILGGAGDYCSSQSWNTFTAFRLDFDHTTANTTACTAAGTTAGTLVGAAAGQVTTPDPSTATIGSGANALVTDATAEYIKFTNTSSIFQSQYGELMFKFNVAGDNAADYKILNIIGKANEDQISVSVFLTGRVGVTFEDHNVQTLKTESSFDIDSACGGSNCYGKWIQLHIKWDTTRCTEAETCGDAGEDELAFRWRYASAGSWAGPGESGASYWSNWAAEVDTRNIQAFATEPDTDDIQVGIISGTFDHAVWVDDLEISNAKPSW